MPGTTGPTPGAGMDLELCPSQFRAITPCGSATLKGSWLWEESLEGEAEWKKAFRGQPSAEKKLPGADQEGKSPHTGTELGAGSKAGQAAWFGHVTLLQPHRNGAAPAWNHGKLDTKRKPAFYTLSMPAQLRELGQCSPAPQP